MKDEISLLKELRECQQELGDLVSDFHKYGDAVCSKTISLRWENRRCPDAKLYSSSKDDSLMDDILDGRVMPDSWKLRDYARAVMALADAVKAKEEATKNVSELRDRIKNIKEELEIE